MQSYEGNRSKRRKAIKQVVKANVKTAKGGVKFCYGLTWFIRILAVILGSANILYIVFLSNDAIDAILLILTFGFPYGLSFLPATVYIVSAGGEYRLRRKEKITLVDGGFVYSYHDDRVNLVYSSHNDRVGLSNIVFAFTVLYENVSKYDYDDKTKALTLHGKIIGDTYENEELKVSNEYNEISLLDVYDFSVKQLLDENY